MVTLATVGYLVAGVFWVGFAAIVASLGFILAKLRSIRENSRNVT